MTERIVAHLDMDAFFASVEQVDHPELLGKPVIVGGTSDRGVVSAASYEARKYGVRSAMPAVTARRLCPEGIFVRGRMSRYAQISRGVMDILQSFVPVVEKASIDEAYMDLSGTERLLGQAVDVCQEIKARIRTSFSLTCSIGIAPNKFLAKIASDWNKPDGLFHILPTQVDAFLENLPVRKIPGVGAKTLETLRKYRIETVGDIRRFSVQFWEERFGQRGRDLWARAHGQDDSPVTSARTPKSCGSENTFPGDLYNVRELTTWLLHQSEEVGYHLRRIGAKGKTVTLKVKFKDFTTITRRTTLHRPTQTTHVIFEAASDLLKQIPVSKGVRLTGVTVSQFCSGPEQLSLFRDEDLQKQEELDRAMDRIKDRFGIQSIHRGRTS